MVENIQKRQYLLSRTSVNLLLTLYFTLAFHAVLYNLIPSTKLVYMANGSSVKQHQIETSN